MTAIKWITAIGIAAAALLGGWMRLTGHGDLSPATHLFLEKQLHCYRLSYHQNILNFGLNNTPLPVKTSLEGTLCIDILHVDTRRVQTAVQLHDFHLQTQPPQPELTNQLAQYYARPVSIVFSPEGRILNFRFPGKATNYAGYAQMLRQMELITGTHNQIVAQEDALGSYQARYTSVSDTIRRQKLHYTASAKGYRIRILASDANATYANGYRSLNFHETLRLLDGNKTTAHVHTTIQLALLSEPYPFPPVASLPEASRATMEANDTDVFQTFRRNQTKRAFKQNGIDASTLLTAIHADPDDLKNYNTLEAYLQIYPDQIVSIRTALKQADNTEARNLIATLDALNLPAAQEILADLAANPDAVTMNRIRSIIALGGQTKPVPEVLQTLSELTEETETETQTDLANTAQLAIGSLCRDPEIAAQYGDRIREALHAASTYSEAKIALLTAKNAGTVPYIDAILPYIHHHDARLRKRAISILAPHRNAEIEAAFQKQMEVENVAEIQALLRAQSKNGTK
jgi:hypothetical protein